MKLVERGEVMGLADYEMVRDRFRARVIEEKKRRRVKLGENATCVFENHDTVLMQIQEMLRTERITREASVMHEITTYNELIPGPHELSATVLIEIDDKELRTRFMTEAAGLDKAFYLLVDGERCVGKHDESRFDPARTTAVHYLKFLLGEKAERALRDVLEKKRSADALTVVLGVEHPKYSATTTFAPALVQDLAEDLA